MATTDHKLRYAGAPHTATGAMVHEDTSITSGVGYARCSCGEMSGCLDSGRQRKAWHKTHKSLFQEGGDPVQQVMDAAPEYIEEEREAMQDKYMPDEEVIEALAEIDLPDPEEDVDSRPLEEIKAEILQERTPVADNPRPVLDEGLYFTDTHFSRANVAGIFWDQFGKLAGKTLAEIHGVEVGFDNSAKVITFSGPEEAPVHEATEDLLEMFDAAKEVHKAWKKSSDAYKALQQGTKEGRQGAYRLTRDFWAGYVQQSTTDLI